jgi:hypothetical protein
VAAGTLAASVGLAAWGVAARSDLASADRRAEMLAGQLADRERDVSRLEAGVREERVRADTARQQRDEAQTTADRERTVAREAEARLAATRKQYLQGIASVRAELDRLEALAHPAEVANQK